VKFKVYTSSQKRRFAPQIKRDVIGGHLKKHQRLGRNYLTHVSGDATLRSPSPVIVLRSPQIACLTQKRADRGRPARL